MVSLIMGRSSLLAFPLSILLAALSGAYAVSCNSHIFLHLIYLFCASGVYSHYSIALNSVFLRLSRYTCVITMFSRKNPTNGNY